MLTLSPKEQSILKFIEAGVGSTVYGYYPLLTLALFRQTGSLLDMVVHMVELSERIKRTYNVRTEVD